LKMLNISNSKSLIDGFRELNIIAVAISYEIEPCGVSKVKELIKKEREGYKKTSKDDLKSMAMGMFNQKGRMHFEFCDPINTELDSLDENEPVNNLIDQVAEIIDNRIYNNFKLWSYNYIAYDLLNELATFRNEYTESEKQSFLSLVDEAMESSEEDKEEIRIRFLKIYANPVINAMKINPRKYFFV